MQTKSSALSIKAAGEADDLAEGQIRAYASVFDNVDVYGDIVQKGAFDRTLAEWKDRGDTLPLLWGHNTSDPDYNIGGIVKASEDDRGLLIEAEFDMDNPKAAQVYRLCKGRRVHDLSFAFDIQESSMETIDGEEVRLLKDLNLFECSIVPYGANPETEIVAVKHAVQSLRGVLAQKASDDTMGQLRELKSMLASAADLIGDLADQDAGSKSSSGHGPSTPAGVTGFNPSDQILVQQLKLNTVI